MKKFKLLTLISLVGFLAAAGLTGCDDDDDPVKPQLRVLHMSYDAPAVNILIDNQIAAPNLTYPESSGYAKTKEGTRNITVVPNGGSTPVIDTDLTLDAARSYTALAVNAVASIEAIATEDDRDPVQDQAKVRFIHASPDAPAVDIRVGSASGPAVFGDAAFKDITDYIEVDGGDYVFTVTPAGNTSSTVARYNPVTLENGQVYTIVAHGTLDALDEVPFAVRAFVDNGSGASFVDLTDANVMAIHASPDAPPVDLLLDDQLVGEDLEFPNNTGYLPILSGEQNIKVNAANTSTTVIDADLTFATGGSHTSVFAYDELADITALVLEDDLSVPDGGFAHVRFVHLSPDAPRVDVAVSGGPVLFADVGFGESDDNGVFTPVASGTYDLEVRLTNTNTVVLSLPGITLEDGRIYTVFAKDFVSALGAEIIVNR